MPRLVRLEALNPHKIEAKDIPEGKALWVCQCGLSRTMPFCDGSHKVARVAEQPGMLCVYDRERQNIVEQRPDE
ncbi:MAG TPA: CDGSH iron-sulfur domain-containing protein [Phycisphaerales bacterium]|nr:CDGSH iron-sulfur domain-containing protein [Phycisphaerales bacterium]